MNVTATAAHLRRRLRAVTFGAVRAALITCLVPLVPTAALAAQAGGEQLRPVTHEDVWHFRRLGTPVLSPSGDLAVVSVKEPSYEEDGDVADLWLLTVDGSAEPRRITATAGPEGDVAWSPDGTRIAFAARRGDDEVSQIYVLDMQGPGEAVRLTDVSTGAGMPRWSPDGTRIAFESRVYPGAADDDANAAEKALRDERGYSASSYEGFPIRQWDRWLDDRKTHLFLQEAKPGAEAVDLLAGTSLAAAPGFSGVPRLSGDSLHAAWTPDGAGLVISATRNRHQAARARTWYHLYLVSTAGGEPQPLTAGEQWSCSQAQFAPDGSALYCKLSYASKYAYNPTQIGRFPWAENGTGGLGEPQLLTGGFDRSVSDFVPASDGGRVYLTARDQGRVRLFVADAGGAAGVEAVDADSPGVYAGPQAAGDHLLARWEDATHPAEIVRIDPAGGGHQRLTAFNVERAAGLDRRPFLEFWTDTGSAAGNEDGSGTGKGRRVHSWVTLPPGFDENEKYPVITMIHGGPHSSSLDADHVRWSPHLLAAPGYVVIQTDYTGSVGYGVEFSRAIQGDPLRTPANEINAALDEAIRRYPFIDADRQAASGASYGGHLVNWLQGNSTRYKTLIGHAGLASLEGQWSTSDFIYHREINNGGPPWGDSPIWRDQSPTAYAERFATPMLLTIGEKDYRVPVNQTLAMWSYLQRLQVPGRLLVFHDANHWIMKGADARHFWSEVHRWLEQRL